MQPPQASLAILRELRRVNVEDEMIPTFYEANLETARDVVTFLVVAAAIGLLGAIVAELLLSRGKANEGGIFELPRRRGRYLDLGSFVAIPVGALAAVIAAYFIVPVREVGETGATETRYDLVRLIVVSALAGLASTGFLASVQEKFTALMTADRLRQGLDRVEAGLAEIERTASEPHGGAGVEAATALRGEVRAQTELVRRQIQETLRME